MTALALQLKRFSDRQPWLFLAVAAALWFALYQTLIPLSEALVGLLPVARDSHLGGALQFFFYDTPKVLLLLTGIVFVMGIVHTFVSPERTRAMLSGRRLGAGNVMAATLGIVTPFCSCSAVPLFIGFLQAGVPLGVTFSFLISAPMVNEVALAMLFGLFGWKVAALYLGLGLLVAIVAGLVIGELKMERHLEDWVAALQNSQGAGAVELPQLSWGERIEQGFHHVREIVGKVWPYILAGIALGAGIHGYVPEDFMASIMGKDAPWWSVPAAVAIGVPMYTNAAGIIPVVEALMGKGAALGTVLAFMMSVIALSAPEMIILRKVLKPRLIATFAGVVAAGILLVGYVFNLVL
ncbi:MAG: permease [Pseudomonadota bacterium]|uniref:permease n=1 Tax=Sulfuricystis thermophila TaxID=2496847 RepID=UPI001036E24A|nr:permease [Sulfuricystis thermophila]